MSVYESCANQSNKISALNMCYSSGIGRVVGQFHRSLIFILYDLTGSIEAYLCWRKG